MSVFDALLLGILQGITEFLPVSSSGHLVVARHLLDWPTQGPHGPILEIALHLGTVLSVLVYYRKDLGMILRSVKITLGDPSLLKSDDEKGKGARLALYIILASIPIAIVGLMFQNPIKGLFDRPDIVSLLLAGTGAILLLTAIPRKKDPSQMSLGGALIVGLVQTVAILPGISRSGVTVTGGLLWGIDRTEAARFSFLMSVPPILGAAILEVRHIQSFSSDYLALVLIGMIAAFLTGWGCLGLLVGLVAKGRFFVFSGYCIPAGLIFFLLCR